MRRRMLASLGGGWNNPYVTDGLVAMWDGEWNAGGGVHDTDAKSLVNLAEGESLAFGSDVEVHDKYIGLRSSVSEQGTATSRIKTATQAYTFELVFHEVLNTAYGRIICFADKYPTRIYHRTDSIPGKLCLNTLGTDHYDRVYDFTSLQSLVITVDGNNVKICFFIIDI